jgi:dihydrofolate reductase
MMTTTTTITTLQTKTADSFTHFKLSLRIEKALTAKLNVIVNRIKKQSETQNQDINVVHQNYETALRDTIENAVTRVFLTASQYVNSTLKRDLKLTQHDLTIIKTLSNEYYSRMQWRINNYILQRDPTKPDITTDFITSTFASYLSAQTLNIATREKSRQILLTKNFYVPKTADMKDIEAQLPAAGLEPTFLPEQPAINVMFQWVTAEDDKVCFEYCAPLEGLTWAVDDPNIPNPHSDTHPNCRCIIVLKET